MPQVSVIMAVYNAQRFLREAVESVLSQTFRDFELIAIDDASSDDSLAILRTFKDERLRIIAHAQNKGAALTRNDGMAAARGSYIAIMDSDDVCSPDRLERQVAFLEGRPEVGLVGCGVYDNLDVDGSVLYTSHLPQDNDTIQATLVERWCFVHPSVMFRKSLVDRVGGYRSQFEPAEDHDLILRIIEHCQTHNLQEKLVGYRINPNGLSVIGHDYLDQLGDAAMRLARARREGRPEDLEAQLKDLVELKRRRKAASPFMKSIYKWRESLYAANRFYGFGCRELYSGRTRQARRCFIRSIKTNGLFAKSWICLGLSYAPFALDNLKFMFRGSARYHDELRRSTT